MDENMALILEKIRPTLAYMEYEKALRIADIAEPKDIPKADGLLKHAEQVLRKTVESLNLSTDNVADIMAMCKAQARLG